MSDVEDEHNEFGQPLKELMRQAIAREEECMFLRQVMLKSLWV